MEGVQLKLWVTLYDDPDGLDYFDSIHFTKASAEEAAGKQEYPRSGRVEEVEVVGDEPVQVYRIGGSE